MTTYLLAHDLGTTGDKATLFDAEGRLVASAFAPYPTFYPRPDWAEQDPNAWWDAVCVSSRDLLDRIHGSRENLGAVSFSGMMNGCLLVDDHGEPLRPAIIHADIRSAAKCSALAAEVGVERAYQITGNRIAPYFTLAKLAWLVDHEPDTLNRARWCVQTKDYLVGRLTGIWGVTDYSDASLTGCLDMASGDWSPELIAAGRFPARLLPEIRPAATIVGTVTQDASEATGLPLGLPVVLGGGDGACATAGAGCVAPGDVYHYLGGTSWIGAVTDGYRPDPSHRASVFYALDGERCVLYATSQSSGSAVDWFRGALGVGESGEDFESLERKAERVPVGSNGLIFLPYLMGERSPIWDSDARAVFFGLSASHGQSEMARAVFEGVAYALGSNLGVLQDLRLAPDCIRVLGGGMRSPLWRSIFAAVYNRPLQLMERLSEATSAGAAMAGAVAIGLYPDYASAAPHFAPLGAIEQPDPESVAVYAHGARIFHALYAALKDLYVANRAPIA